MLLMVLEGTGRGGGYLGTFTPALVLYVRRTSAWTHYIVMPIIRASSEGLIGFYNRVLGGPPLPPLYHPSRLILDTLTLKFGESPYAAAGWVLAPRMLTSWARREARTFWVIISMEATMLRSWSGRPPPPHR